MTKWFFALIILFAPMTAMAQFDHDYGREGEILAQPLCSALVNRSGQAILGTLSTAGQQLGSGDIVRHRDNFRLEAGERQEFCSAGPFYEGRRIEIVLKTLIPLFNCKTRIDRGDIYLDAKPDRYGIKKLSATCY